MERFGYRKILEELNGSKIHCLENILTLDSSIHTFFDELKLWFEPTVGHSPHVRRAGIESFQDKHDTYKLCATRSGYINDCDTTVTFTTPDPTKLPVPSRTYLDIHAACCRVAHLSGGGEYIDAILRELEYTTVLSEDGASIKALQYALMPFSHQIPVH